MLEKKRLKIELTGSEAEKIVTNWVSARMAEQGYQLTYSRNEQQESWPDTFWRGDIEGKDNG